MITKHQVMTNFIWKLAERCGSQVITFIVSIILARLLLPEDYGKIALCMVFILILQVFTDSGLGTALIQKKEPDRLDFSSVFYANMAIALVLYAGMYAAAPWIAAFYHMPDLSSVVRVLSLVLVGNALQNVQQAYVSKHMIFKRFFYSTVGASLVSAVVGIFMAYQGCGIWALVAQQLLGRYVGAGILWLTVPFRPVLAFSWQRLKGLYSFGWKMLASALLDTGYNNLRNLIIGRMYSAADLAFYNQGELFTKVIVGNINTSIDSVLLPTMAGVQNNHARVKGMTRRAIMTSSYIMAPMMMGLAFCAEPIVRLVLTEKWMDCVPFLRIFCITYMFYPIHTANLNAITAMGRSDLFLKLEIAKKCVGLTLIFSTMWYGVMAMAYSLLVGTLLSMIINSWPNRKLLHYSYLEQMRDILPSIAAAVVMGASVYSVVWLGFSDFVTLSIQIPLGMVLYVLFSWILHLESFSYLLGMVWPLLEDEGKAKK